MTKVDEFYRFYLILTGRDVFSHEFKILSNQIDPDLVKKMERSDPIILVILDNLQF